MPTYVVGLLRSILLTRVSATRSLNAMVARRFVPLLPQSFTNLYLGDSCILNNHEKFCTSSQPTAVTELVLANEWSDDMENELEQSKSMLTHESVLYILKKLDKDPQKAFQFFNWVSVKNGFEVDASVYNLILRILGQKEWMKDFWILLKKMENRGIELNEGTYKTLLSYFGKERMSNEGVALTQFFSKMTENNAKNESISKVSGIMTNPDWKKELTELKLDLSHGIVLKILRELREDPSKALNFFNWAGDQNDYENNGITYNAILRILGRDDKIEQFWAIVKEMKSKGHEIDIDTYIKLSRQFQKKMMVKDAVELYELMMKGPFKPSIDDCSLLLRQISSNGHPDMDLVFKVVRIYEEAGHSLSKAIYDGIHRSLTSVGRFVEAEQILQTMKNAGFEPDNITYSQIVFGLCKARRLDEACKLLDDMETNGCVPDLKTWTILIQGHCMVNEVDKALDCLTKMIDKNCQADADLLDILVKALCKKNKTAGAYLLMDEMIKNSRIRPWQATYKHLIQRLLQDGIIEEALKVLKLMKSHNYPPFSEPFLKYMSKYGTVEDAKDLLKALTVKNYPSSSIYLHLLKSFIDEGRYVEAQDLLYKCPFHIRKDAAILSLFKSEKLVIST